MSDLVKETDSILIQSHYMLKSHRIFSVTYATNLFEENVLWHMTIKTKNVYIFKENDKCAYGEEAGAK